MYQYVSVGRAPDCYNNSGTIGENQGEKSIRKYLNVHLVDFHDAFLYWY